MLRETFSLLFSHSTYLAYAVFTETFFVRAEGNLPNDFIHAFFMTNSFSPQKKGPIAHFPIKQTQKVKQSDMTIMKLVESVK